MAEKAHDGARASRRRNVKFADIEGAARGDRRMGEMGLAEALTTEEIFAEARGDAGGKTKSALGTKQSQAGKPADAKHMRSISAFFS